MERADKVSILGTEYKIEYRNEEDDKLLEKCSGYIDESVNLIVISNIPKDNERANYDVMQKKTLRHEIVHGFLIESGLVGDSGSYENAWALNEEMIDWIARQIIKIYEACKDVGAI